MHHALVTDTGGTWLVRVDPWNDDNPILHLFLYFRQAADVITHRVFVMGRAWTDNQQKLAAFFCENRFNTGVLILFYIAEFPVKGHSRKNIPRL